MWWEQVLTTDVGYDDASSAAVLLCCLNSQTASFACPAAAVVSVTRRRLQGISSSGMAVWRSSFVPLLITSSVLCVAGVTSAYHGLHGQGEPALRRVMQPLHDTTGCGLTAPPLVCVRI